MKSSNFDRKRVVAIAEWKSWLEKNHLTKDGVWLVLRKKSSGLPTLSYNDLLDEALAYGWIDSLTRTVDDMHYEMKFTPRRPSSIWSKLNIERVNRLIASGRMTKWGLDLFNQRTSKISMLDQVNMEGIKMPWDFKRALKLNPKANQNFEKFGKGYRKRYLMWICSAKKTRDQEETN